jgi:adenylate kinase family enzyme
MNMNRVVIIGSPGAGKSTLARDLGRILHMNVVHLDRVFWGHGWKKKPRKTRIDILQEIVQINDRWIIEGTYLGSSKPRLEAADTIIFLDTMALVCLYRIFKRHFNDEVIHRAIPDGCHDKLSFFRILKVMVFPFKGRIALKQKLLLYESESRHIIRLSSKKDIEVFLAQLDPQPNIRKKFPQAPSTSRKKQLATARR